MAQPWHLIIVLQQLLPLLQVIQLHQLVIPINGILMEIVLMWVVIIVLITPTKLEIIA